MTKPKKYTRTETVEAWQWNGPEDNRGVVESFPYPCVHCKSPAAHGYISRGIWVICPGSWIIKREGEYHYKVITDAEFKAQGWKEMVE